MCTCDSSSTWLPSTNSTNGSSLQTYEQLEYKNKKRKKLGDFKNKND